MKQRIVQLWGIIMLFFINCLHAQNEYGTISGKIFTSDNLPAEYINVYLENTNYGAITNSEGSFVINRVKSGTYTMVFSLLGLATKTKVITVLPNETTYVTDITLSETKTTLGEVVINAQRLNQFAQKKSPYVSRLPIKNIETPQSYTVVSEALMDEQISVDLPSSLKSITGGGYVESITGAVSVYTRGFRGDARVKNGLLMYPRARTVIENQNIERVEVIKGPSAVNYGAGFYGGLVNLVTKKPLVEDKFDVSYMLGSFNLHRITTDYNKSFGNNNEYRFRINGAFHREDGFQNKGSEIRQNYFIAPTFTYKPSEKFSVTLQSEFLKGRRNLNFARGTSRKITENTWSDIQWDFDNSYTSKDIAGEMDYSLLQLETDYNFAKNWTSKTGVSYTNFYSKAPYFRLNALTNTQIQREFLEYLSEKGGATNIRQDFIGTYTFSTIKNKVLIGASYYKGFWNYTRKIPSGRGWFVPIDIIDTETNNPIPNLTMDILHGITDTKLDRAVLGDNTIAGYVNNAVTLYDKVTFITGLRYDHFNNDSVIQDKIKEKDDYNQGKLSYNFGVSVHPFSDQLSFFGNYMNGFKNAAPGLNEHGEIQNFNPEEVRQWETGVKLDLFSGRLKSTLSYYSIAIDNALLRYRTRSNTYQKQNGKIRSNGLEVDIIANPFSGFNIVAGYTYNNARNIKHSSPQATNKQLDLSPRTVANVWASYKFTRGAIKGLGFGFGTNHMSRIFAAGNVGNTFWSKPYTTMDGTVFYQQKKYRVGVKVNNLSDLQYYNAYGIPQRPFNFIMALTYKL